MITDFPLDIVEAQLFLLWRFENDQNKNKPNKKPSKVPYHIVGVSDNTKPNYTLLKKGIPQDKSLLCTFHQANLWLDDQDIADRGYQLGFCLFDSDFFVIDLDNCILLENSPDFTEIKKHFPFVYTEISSSKKGMHIIGKGRSSNKGNKALLGLKSGGSLEFYDGKDNRFFTITGNFVLNNLYATRMFPLTSMQSFSWLHANYFSDTIVPDRASQTKQINLQDSKKYTKNDNEHPFTDCTQNIDY